MAGGFMRYGFYEYLTTVECITKLFEYEPKEFRSVKRSAVHQ
jgi:hypothetical protein